MKKILKSFMISFVKSWVETIGTILFLLMLCAIVLGMLTTPLQINFKIHAVQSASNTPDNFIKVDANAFNDDFIEQFFLDDTPYIYHDDNIDLKLADFPDGLDKIDPLRQKAEPTDGDNDES
jgi:putative ABC transport system permease protein